MYCEMNSTIIYFSFDPKIDNVLRVLLSMHTFTCMFSFSCDNNCHHVYGTAVILVDCGSQCGIVVSNLWLAGGCELNLLSDLPLSALTVSSEYSADYGLSNLPLHDDLSREQDQVWRADDSDTHPWVKVCSSQYLLYLCFSMFTVFLGIRCSYHNDIYLCDYSLHVLLFSVALR